MSGMLFNQWTLPDFYPTGDIPSGVRLTGYSGDATDLPRPGAATVPYDDVSEGEGQPSPLGQVFRLDPDPRRPPHDGGERRRREDRGGHVVDRVDSQVSSSQTVTMGAGTCTGSPSFPGLCRVLGVAEVVGGVAWAASLPSKPQ